MNGDIIFSGDSLSRLDAMNLALNPRQTDAEILGDLQANLELLYIRAKNFHWNVKGVGFQGVHELFDRIQAFATESSDRVAERMRYYGHDIQATAAAYLRKAWFSEDLTFINTQEAMLMDMCRILQTFHDNMVQDIDNIDCPISQNMIQDIAEQLDKFNYFVKSNMSTFPQNA